MSKKQGATTTISNDDFFVVIDENNVIRSRSYLFEIEAKDIQDAIFKTVGAAKSCITRSAELARRGVIIPQGSTNFRIVRASIVVYPNEIVWEQ